MHRMRFIPVALAVLLCTGAPVPANESAHEPAFEDRTKMTRTKEEVLAEVRALAVEYYQLTEKPLGVTGEIGEVEAAEKMMLKLAPPRTEGYDATRSDGWKIQIKSRWGRDGVKSSGRISKIDTSKKFDSVMLVLMRDDYEVYEIWEAGRQAVIDRLTAPGSRSRNERGQMSVSQFKDIADQVWPK